MNRASFRTAAARIAATISPTLTPGKMIAPTALAADARGDQPFDSMVDQLPLICRQDGGTPYVLYEFDDNDAVTHARVSCFNPSPASSKKAWLCEADYAAKRLRTIPLDVQPSRRRLLPTGITLFGSFDEGTSQAVAG